MSLGNLSSHIALDTLKRVQGSYPNIWSAADSLQQNVTASRHFALEYPVIEECHGGELHAQSAATNSSHKRQCLQRKNSLVQRPNVPLKCLLITTVTLWFYQQLKGMHPWRKDCLHWSQYGTKIKYAFSFASASVEFCF
jgi:hypothetical protein